MLHKDLLLSQISSQKVITKTIQNCFVYCHFKYFDTENLNIFNCKNEAILKVQCIEYYGQFVGIDNFLQTLNKNENLKNAIVEQIATKHEIYQKMSKMKRMTNQI